MLWVPGSAHCHQLLSSGAARVSWRALFSTNPRLRVAFPLRAQSTCGKTPGEAPCLLCTHRKDAAEACACRELFKLDACATLEKRGGEHTATSSAPSGASTGPLHQQPHHRAQHVHTNNPPDSQERRQRLCRNPFYSYSDYFQKKQWCAVFLKICLYRFMCVL